MEEIKNVIDFIIEVEKLKSIKRKTRPVGLDRYENSAEHSWHVCLTALMLKDYANEVIDIGRVIKMLLIHDLGEIDAGDKIIYECETPEQKNKELAGVQRILSYLPKERAREYEALWTEFEAGETSDSIYARSIDRIPPILHNLNGQGHSWKTHGIRLNQVLKVNSRIGTGCSKVWDYLRSQIKQAVDNGILQK